MNKPKRTGGIRVASVEHSTEKETKRCGDVEVELPRMALKETRLASGPDRGLTRVVLTVTLPEDFERGLAHVIRTGYPDSLGQVGILVAEAVREALVNGVQVAVDQGWRGQ